MKLTRGVSALVVLVVLSGCVTQTAVVIDSNVSGAEVYLNNRLIGTTPITTQLSNAIWEEYTVRLIAKGYRDLYGSLHKEVKAFNLISGLILFWPALLWVYGPEAYQHFDMIEVIR